MATTYTDDDELGTTNHPYLLVRRVPSVGPASFEEEDDDAPLMDLSATQNDRMGPAASGIIAGFFAGAAGLGVVHALAPQVLVRAVVDVAAARALDPAIVLGIAYATTAAIGSLVGATFAVVTRYLRKWAPLLLWALVFFVSLTLLVLAVPPVNGRVVAAHLPLAILTASAAFAFVVSFSLPIRRRR